VKEELGKRRSVCICMHDMCIVSKQAILVRIRYADGNLVLNASITITKKESTDFCICIPTLLLTVSRVWDSSEIE
jgi:hypothetical protein